MALLQAMTIAALLATGMGAALLGSVKLALARTYGLALVGVLLLSAGWAILINVVNPLSLVAFPGTETYAMNLACFFFGLGAFLTPLAAAVLLKWMGLARALL